MKAVIISEHEGNRLRPLTCTEPKCMLPVLGRTIAGHMLRLLRRHNISDVTFIPGYLSEEVKKHFGNASVDDVSVSFAEKSDIRTLIENDDVLIVSGSLVTDIDIDAFYNFHREQGRKITVFTRSHIPPSDYGAVKIADNCAHFGDNIFIDGDATGTFFMGMMVISKGTLTSDFSSVWNIPLRFGESGGKVAAFSSGCYICDVCDIDAYMKCSRDFLDKKINLPFPCDEKEPGVWIDRCAEISRGVVIVPPVYIGSGSLISRGVRLEAHSVIGKDVFIGERASVKRSIVMDNAQIGIGSSLRGAVIGTGAETGFESAVYESAIIGSRARLGKHCTVRPSVRIWPYKEVSDDKCVSSNIIWENMHTHRLFSDGCASGKINSDITPEFACMLGSAAAFLFGGKIAVSSDCGGSGTMIKNALIAGIQSAGALPYDFGEQPLPITRSGIKFYSMNGGIAISTYEKDGEVFAELDIINSNGADIENEDLIKIEQYVSFNDYTRAKANAVPEPDYLFEYKLYYLKRLINSTTKKELGAKILISAPSHWAQNLLKSASDDLKCEFHFTDEQIPSKFCAEIRRSEYDFGAIIDHRCEKLTIVTRSGNIISEFDYAALTSLIIMKTYPGAELYTPLSSPDSIDIMAKKFGATVHRTKMSPPCLMNELSHHAEKAFMHQFIFRFDAVGALIMLLDYICSAGTTLDSLLAELPQSHVISAEVDCPGESREVVSERLRKQFPNEIEDTPDALKFSFENGWVLVVPHRRNGSIRIISHGLTEEYARELTDIFTDSIAD